MLNVMRRTEISKSPHPFFTKAVVLVLVCGLVRVKSSVYTSYSLANLSIVFFSITELLGKQFDFKF